MCGVAAYVLSPIEHVFLSLIAHTRAVALHRAGLKPHLYEAAVCWSYHETGPVLLTLRAAQIRRNWCWCGTWYVVAGSRLLQRMRGPYFIIFAGPNAVHALQGLGILEDVLAKADPPKLAMRPYTFISGAGNHEHLFDVSAQQDSVAIPTLTEVFTASMHFLRMNWVSRSTGAIPNNANRGYPGH